MSTNFFDQQDEGEFRDMPDEVVEGTQAPPVQNANPPQPRRAPATPPQKVIQQEPEYNLEDVEIEIEDDDEDDYTSVLSDARLRLEQGRLYEMIMNHDLFEGLDSDPAAIKHVQRQIRKFAKEQMEIMLGMRRETTKVDRLEIDFPFNQVEVTVLKKLAFAASKGASENSDRFVPDVKRVTEDVPVIGRKEGLNRIASVSKPPLKQAPKPAQKASPAPAVAKTKLPSAPAKPVARKPLSANEQQILAEEQVTIEELNSTFEPTYKPLQKPLHEMTADEILERNRQASERRHKTVKNPSAMPMPTPDQESMFHQHRVLETSSTSGISTIMALINQQTKK